MPTADVNDPKIAKAIAKAQRPWYRKKRYVLSAVFVVLVAIVAIGSGGDDDAADGGGGEAMPNSAAGSSAAADDVEITGCSAVENLGWVEADLAITNHSSKRSNYVIEITVENVDGVKVADGVASTNNLDPGQTARETAQTAQEVDGDFTCKIAEVTRYAS